MEEGTLVDGRFRILEEIGSGGMGVVFRAIDEQAGRMVAVKVLDGHTGQQIERGYREAEVLARLSHPAIVRHVADGKLSDGSLYVAMEWIDGVTVADRIVKQGFTLAETVVMARGIADALASAHRAEVLHRDLKPSNILLANNQVETPRLIDFGVARVTDAVRALTRTGAAIGTPGYMSPEQARGERALTPAADVFGLGCVVYECATGKPAFSGSAAAAVMTKILFAEPEPIRAVCPEAAEPLNALVARMLAKDVRARFPDCGAVVAAFDALGQIPDGPRRSSRRLAMDATHIARVEGAVHCMVAAARGNADDLLEPPSVEQRALLEQAAKTWTAHVEFLATGAVVVHVTGEVKDASHRAATVALAMRRILPGWSIAISQVAADAAIAADEGTALLTQAAMAAIFGRSVADRISVDPSTAHYLAIEFVIDHDAGPVPQLVGPKDSRD